MKNIENMQILGDRFSRIYDLVEPSDVAGSGFFLDIAKEVYGLFIEDGLIPVADGSITEDTLEEILLVDYMLELRSVDILEQLILSLMTIIIVDFVQGIPSVTVDCYETLIQHTTETSTTSFLWSTAVNDPVIHESIDNLVYKLQNELYSEFDIADVSITVSKGLTLHEFIDEYYHSFGESFLNTLNKLCGNGKEYQQNIQSISVISVEINGEPFVSNVITAIFP